MDDHTEFIDEPVETGIVTATVTASGSEPGSVSENVMTPEAIQAAKALVNLPDISAVALAQLAREIAQDIGMLPAILQRHKLTQAQYEFLEKHNRFFKGILEGETRNWQSIKSTEVRLRLQAQAALEQQMPGLATRMGNAAEKLSDAVEAAKFFARVAGVDAPQPGAAVPGERYTITIDLGADTRITVGAQGDASPRADAARTETVRTNPQGQSYDGAMAKLVGQS